MSFPFRYAKSASICTKKSVVQERLDERAVGNIQHSTFNIQHSTSNKEKAEG
jgi:hypothetical protein